MLWQTKIMLFELYSAAWLNEVTKKKNDPIMDILATTAFGWASMKLWAPEIAIATKTSAVGIITPLFINPVTAAVASTVAVGGVVSYAIGEGQGVEDYYDFMSDPMDMYNKTVEVTIPAIAHELEIKLVEAKVTGQVALQAFQNTPLVKAIFGIWKSAPGWSRFWWL